MGDFIPQTPERGTPRREFLAYATTDCAFFFDNR